MKVRPEQVLSDRPRVNSAALRIGKLLPALLIPPITSLAQSAHPVARFPRIDENTPAHRRAAWASRGPSDHTELSKTLRTIPTYIVYDKIAGLLRASPEE